MSEYQYANEIIGCINNINDEVLNAYILTIPDREVREIIGRRAKIQARYIPISVKSKLIKEAVLSSPEIFSSAFFSSVLNFLKNEILTEEQFENPQVDDLKLSLDEVSEHWGQEISYAFICYLASETFVAQSNAKLLLETISRPSFLEVANSERESEVDEEYVEVLPEVEDFYSDELLYTPLTKAIIRLIIAVAADEEGVLDVEVSNINQAEGIRSILLELFASNSRKNNYWFLAGYASGMRVVEKDFKMDSLSLNEDRRAWQFSGYIYASLRYRTAEPDIILNLLQERRNEVPLLFGTPFALQLCPHIIDELVQIEPSLISNFLQSLFSAMDSGQQFRLSEIFVLLDEIDSLSVRLLRQDDFVRAAVILQPSIEFVGKLSEPFDRGAKGSKNLISKIYQLNIQLRLGMAASERLRANFAQAEHILNSIQSHWFDFVEPRVQHRFFFQQVLAFSKTNKIEDVVLPRNSNECEVFARKYGEYRELLENVVDSESSYYEIYNTKFDALYILAGLDICNEDYQSARQRLDQVGSHFETRIERSHLVPGIKWLQIEMDLLVGGIGTVTSALQTALPNISLSLRLNDQEVDLILRKSLSTSSEVRTSVIRWLAYSEQTTNANISLDVLAEYLPDASIEIGDLLVLADRLKQIKNRFEFFSQSVSIRSFEDYGKLIDYVETLLATTNPEIRKLWADFLRSNEEFRSFYGEFDSNIEALLYLVSLGKKEDALHLCEELLDEFQPVINEEMHVQYHSIVDIYQELNPTYSQLYREDAKGKLPDVYVPYERNAEDSKEQFESIRVYFIGGTEEEQGRRKPEILAKISETYGDSVELEFIFPGWGSNWMQHIERMKRHLKPRDVVVLMPLVRTNFGIKLRKLVGDCDAFWVACSGNGVASMVNSIERAIHLSRLRLAAE